MSLEFPLRIRELLSKPQLVACDLRITTAVSMNHVEPCGICAWRYWILIDSEASWIREVRAHVTQTLEDVVAMLVAGYWSLCLKRGIWYVRHSSKRSWIRLREPWCFARGGRSLVIVRQMRAASKQSAHQRTTRGLCQSSPGALKMMPSRWLIPISPQPHRWRSQLV